MSVAADEITRAYRRQQLALRAQTVREMAAIWPALANEALDDSWPVFAVAASSLIQRQRRQAAGLASSYLRAHRLASGVAGTPVVRIAGPAASVELAKSLHTTSVVAIKKSMTAGLSLPVANTNALVRASGAATRHVLDGGRETVMQSAAADPTLDGWQRVTFGGCTFCRNLAERGTVYANESVDFGAHDHCMCSAEPVYDGQALKAARRDVRDYTQSARSETPSWSRASQRDYLADVSTP